MSTEVYRFSFRQILFLMLAICGVVFLPGCLILAYGATVITEMPSKFTFETLIPQVFMVLSTSCLVIFTVLWYADWAFPTIMRTFARLLNNVEITDAAAAEQK